MRPRGQTPRMRSGALGFALVYPSFNEAAGADPADAAKLRSDAGDRMIRLQ